MKGTELRALRHSLNWSQAKLAKEMGCSWNSVARYERDEMTISEPIARLVGFIVEKAKSQSQKARASTKKGVHF